jgi:hypothetical protein
MASMLSTATPANKALSLSSILFELKSRSATTASLAPIIRIRIVADGGSGKEKSSLEKDGRRNAETPKASRRAPRSLRGCVRRGGRDWVAGGGFGREVIFWTFSNRL